MSVMIIKSLYLFHMEEAKAKHVSFVPGKNVITSSSIDGNNAGKTTLLKSIYHTLGADIKFNDMWPTRDIVYVVYADVDGAEYVFYRHHKLFRVFCNGEFLFETTHRHELASFLEEQFGMAVYLPNRQGDQLELATPAFSYVLNYLDDPKGPVFTSFDKLSEYKNAKEMIIYNHLGAFDKQYYQIHKEYEIKTVEKTNAEHKLTILQGMIERISEEIVEADYSLDIDTLQKEIEGISHTYNVLVDELSKIKKQIVKCSNARIAVKHQLSSLYSEQKRLRGEIAGMNANHRCPRCQSVVDDLTNLRASGYNQQAALVVMYDRLSQELLEVERKTSQLQADYRTKLAQVDTYNEKMKQARGYSSDIVRQAGAVQIRDQFVSEAHGLFTQIEGLKVQIKTLNNDLREYKKRIETLNDEYYRVMRRSIDRFSLQEIEDEKIKKIGGAFKATENNTRVATIIWIYTLLQLKAWHNPDALILPILIDSPSYGELDDTKQDVLWKFLFDHPMAEAQLIITKLDFTEEMKEQYSVDSVIMLDNPKYQMLDSDTFRENIHMLESLQQIREAATCS